MERAIPRNPSKDVRKLNPSVYAPGSFESLQVDPLTKVPLRQSPFEEKFWAMWESSDGGNIPLEREVAFEPGRRWKFDFAHGRSRTAIELEGGVYSGGRHTRGGGFVRDAEKYNRAALRGWVVFRIPTGGLKAELIRDIRSFIRARSP